MPAGRPTKYDPKYCDEILEYFDIEAYREVDVLTTDKKTGREYINSELRANDLPFFSGFARKIGVNGDTLVEWSHVYPEFSAAYKEAKELQTQILATNALQGLYNPSFAIFTAKNISGWRDQKEMALTGKDGGPIAFVDMASDDGEG